MRRPPRDPQPDLGALRRSLGLPTDSAAKLLSVTPEVLVNYESRGWGYDPAHDQFAIEMYLHWAIGTYASETLYRTVFGESIKNEAAPGATGTASHVTTKGN